MIVGSSQGGLRNPAKPAPHVSSAPGWSSTRNWRICPFVHLRDAKIEASHSKRGECLSEHELQNGAQTFGRVAGVAYRTIPEMPGATFFDCSRLHAGLTTRACTDMWRAANQARSERHTACRSCFVGATHAGVSNASRSPIRNAMVCGRCGRGATRLIKKHLCVSCANRQYELIKGRNARGMVPTKLAPLAARRVLYMSNGRVHLIRSEHTTNSAELIIATLRDAVHTVAFAWPGVASRPWSAMRALDCGAG
jgi:hypothetical protein